MSDEEEEMSAVVFGAEAGSATALLVFFCLAAVHGVLPGTQTVPTICCQHACAAGLWYWAEGSQVAKKSGV